MSASLISRNSDLTRLVDDGYHIEVRHNHLLMKDVPYVNAAKEVKFGVLVSSLDLAGDVTIRPSTHVMYFIGEHPCKRDGTMLAEIAHSSTPQQLAQDLTVHHSFSSKPSKGYYDDYFEKMTTYAAILTSQAQAIDPTVTARSRALPEEMFEDTAFHYRDTASSRAGISQITNKLAVQRVAIVGLGGTGSYLLDLIAKTPIHEIHLFDGDTFATHNAFRAPGAPSLDELRARPMKVTHFHAIYSQMHRGIEPHSVYVDATNTHLLQGMDFVFVCVDNAAARTIVVDALRAAQIPFIDVGMGLEIVDDKITGAIRTTGERPGEVSAHLPLGNAAMDDIYSSNVQVADLNALNATLAVIRWKKWCGFYLDLDQERHSVYTIDGNHLINEAS